MHKISAVRVENFRQGSFLACFLSFSKLSSCFSAPLQQKIQREKERERQKMQKKKTKKKNAYTSRCLFLILLNAANGKKKKTDNTIYL